MRETTRYAARARNDYKRVLLPRSGDATGSKCDALKCNARCSERDVRGTDRAVKIYPTRSRITLRDSERNFSGKGCARVNGEKILKKIDYLI